MMGIPLPSGRFSDDEHIESDLTPVSENVVDDQLPTSCNEDTFRKYMSESAINIDLDKLDNNNDETNTENCDDTDKAREVYQKLSFDFPQIVDLDGKSLLSSIVTGGVSGDLELPRGCTFNRTLINNITEAAIKESNGLKGFDAFGEVYHRVVLKGLLHLLTCKREDAAALLRDYKVPVEASARTAVVEVLEDEGIEHTFGEEDDSDFEFEDYDTSKPTECLASSALHTYGTEECTIPLCAKLMDLYSFITPITLMCISHDDWVGERVTDTIIAIVAHLSELHLDDATNLHTCVHGAEDGSSKDLSVTQGVGLLTALMSTRPILVEVILPRLISVSSVDTPSEKPKQASDIIERFQHSCVPYQLSILECVPLVDGTVKQGAPHSNSVTAAQSARDTQVTYDGWRAYARAVSVCLPVLAEVAAEAVSVVLLHQKELKKQARLAEKTGSEGSGRGTIFDPEGLAGLRHEVASVTAVVRRYVQHGPRETVAGDLLGCGLWRDLVRLVVQVGVVRRNDADNAGMVDDPGEVKNYPEAKAVECVNGGKDVARTDRNKNLKGNLNVEIAELLKVVTYGCCGYEELSAYTQRVSGFKAAIFSLGKPGAASEERKIDRILLPDLYIVWLCIYAEANAPDTVTSYVAGVSVPELQSLSLAHMHLYCDQASDTASRLKALLSLLEMLKMWKASHKLNQPASSSKSRAATQDPVAKSKSMWAQLSSVMQTTYSTAEKLVKQIKNTQQFRTEWNLPAPSSKEEDESHGVVHKDTERNANPSQRTDMERDSSQLDENECKSVDALKVEETTSGDRSVSDSDSVAETESSSTDVEEAKVSEAERELREKVVALHALCYKGLWQLHRTLKTDFLSQAGAGSKAD